MVLFWYIAEFPNIYVDVKQIFCQEIQEILWLKQMNYKHALLIFDRITSNFEIDIQLQ